MTLSERKIRWILAGIGFGCFVLLLILEVATESDEISGVDIAVDALTLLLTIASAVGVALLAQRLQAHHEEKLTLIRDLETARVQGDHWRDKVRSHIAGIRMEMERQFAEWGLSAAEKEIAMLMLKGLSHKEIATLRGTSEATVRQQAQSIYAKSDLPGKTAFSAYFLDDVFASEVPEDGPYVTH